MRFFTFLGFLLLGIPTISHAQFTFSGQVVNEQNQPLPGSQVTFNQNQIVTDANGKFQFINIASGKYRLEILFIGYQKNVQNIAINSSQNLKIVLTPEIKNLESVTVTTENQTKQLQQKTSTSIEVVDENFLKKNLGGSLMQTLERVGGISTIAIGSGQSKPIIRGLGFNRVVVSENGVKHESQQWGSDHGLEIDQFSVNKIKIVKGPSSLAFGSDAIGGVVEIEKAKAPEKNTFGGNLDLTAKTNNDLYGGSLNLFGRKNSLFFDARITSMDYADYKVPVDFINIYSYQAPLFKNRMRNTAGKELNLHLNFGVMKDNFSSVFYVSNFKMKSGLFANAHGLEPRNVDTDLHDFSARDIQNPYQDVNHFKVINRTKFTFENHRLELELGYQNNFREEFSDYIPHGFMPSTYPENLRYPETLERGFSKNVYSLNAKDIFSIGNHQITIGFNGEHQDNNIDGWGFVIPEFEQTNAGIFALDQFEINEKLTVNAGIRYDFGQIKTGNYFDWFASPINDTEAFLQRATALKRNFGNISWGIGANYNLEDFSYRINVGKSFRMPIAKELASNGVNYHQFSYELGNANLNPEEAYQFDLGLTFEKNNFSADLSPFLNYFTNYIYLNPTANFDYSYGAGNQIYEYTQSKVMQYGTELKLNYRFTQNYSAEIIGEYVYSEQLSGAKKGFTLPFSPPASVLFNFSYNGNFGKNFPNAFAGIDFKYVAAQNLIVPPENKTPDYQLINLQFGADFFLSKQKIGVHFQVQNLLNSKNFNHTSFYRLIGVPEPGRNFVMNVKVPFLF